MDPWPPWPRPLILPRIETRTLWPDGSNVRPCSCSCSDGKQHGGRRRANLFSFCAGACSSDGWVGSQMFPIETKGEKGSMFGMIFRHVGHSHRSGFAHDRLAVCCCI
ncbi:hypothetical protein ZWY2020_044823 [Hordeum vulgare]|nr:hypothetical protein ZWY2020_044823 [Hordeum vulgare]